MGRAGKGSKTVAKPIFLDPTGRRGRWTGRSLAALILLVLTATAVLAFTIIEVPIPAPLPLRMDQAHHGLIDRIAGAGRRVAEATFGHRWLPPSPRGATGRQVVSAFYVPWDEASRASLAAHVNELDWVIPTAAFVTGPDHHFEAQPDPHFDAIMAGAQRRPLILPMVQNAANQHFDGPGITALLHDPRASARLLDQIEQMVAMRHGAGIVFDFEEIPPPASATICASLPRPIAASIPTAGPSRWRRRSAIPTGISPPMPMSPTRSS